MSEALEKVAAEHGIQSVTAIALAYLLAKSPFVFPIIGGRKIEHLHDNIEALKIELTDEQIQYLESIVPFDPGFPWNFVSHSLHVIPNCGSVVSRLFHPNPPVLIQVGEYDHKYYRRHSNQARWQSLVRWNSSSVG